MAHGRADEEDSRDLRRLVIVRQKRRAGQAALCLVRLACQAEEVGGNGGDAALKAGAEYGRL